MSARRVRLYHAGTTNHIESARDVVGSAQFTHHSLVMGYEYDVVFELYKSRVTYEKVTCGSTLDLETTTLKMNFPGIDVSKMQVYGTDMKVMHQDRNLVNAAQVVVLKKTEPYMVTMRQGRDWATHNLDCSSVTSGLCESDDLTTTLQVMHPGVFVRSIEVIGMAGRRVAKSRYPSASHTFLKIFKGTHYSLKIRTRELDDVVVPLSCDGETCAFTVPMCGVSVNLAGLSGSGAYVSIHNSDGKRVHRWKNVKGFTSPAFVTLGDYTIKMKQGGYTKEESLTCSNAGDTHVVTGQVCAFTGVHTGHTAKLLKMRANVGYEAYSTVAKHYWDRGQQIGLNYGVFSGSTQMGVLKGNYEVYAVFNDNESQRTSVNCQTDFVSRDVLPYQSQNYEVREVREEATSGDEPFMEHVADAFHTASVEVLSSLGLVVFLTAAVCAVAVSRARARVQVSPIGA